VVDLLYDPILHRFLATHEPTPTSYADTPTEHIWPRISPPPRQRHAPSSHPSRRRAASWDGPASPPGRGV